MPNNLRIEIAVQGGQQARQILNQIGRAVRETAEQANAGAAGAAGGWASLIGAFHHSREALAPLREGFGELRKAGREFGNALNELADNVLPHFREVAALSVGAAAVGFVELARKAAENVHEMKNLAETAGLTIEQLQQLKTAGVLGGVGDEATTTMLSRFARSWGQLSIAMKQGGAAAEDAKKKLVELGIQGGTGTAGKMWTAEGGMAQTLPMLQKVAEALSRIDDVTKRDALSNEYFGRSYVEIMPLLNHFLELMGQSQKLITDYGIGITKTEEEQSHAFTTSWNTMSTVLGRERDMLGNMLGTVLVPLFTDLYDTVGRNTDSIMRFGQAIATRVRPVIADFITLIHVATGEVKDFNPARDLQTDVVRQLYFAFLSVRSAVIQAKDAFEAAGKVMMTVLDGVAKAIDAVFGTQFTGEGLAAILLLGRITGAWKVLATAIGVATAAQKAFFAIAAAAAAAAAVPTGAAAAAGVGLGGLTAGGIAGMRKFVANGGDPGDVLRYGGGGAGMATGGIVSGPSGTDKVPIWATAGEAIINTRSVAKYGRALFQSLNAMKFAAGGFVGDDTLSQGIAPALSGSTDLASQMLGGSDLVGAALGSSTEQQGGGTFKSSPYVAPSFSERMAAGLSAILGKSAVQSLTRGILPEGITPSMLKTVMTGAGSRIPGSRRIGVDLTYQGRTYYLEGDENDAQALSNFARLSRLTSAGNKPSWATS